MIAVVDAGSGNLRRTVQALRAAALHSVIHDTVAVTADADVVGRAARVVVAGAGAFADACRRLGRDTALGRALLRAVQAGTPYLGIGLGLQLLFDGSEEAPEGLGLGLLRGRAARLTEGLADGRGGRLKVPHTGWNEVTPVGRPHPVLAAGAAPAPERAGVPYYFAHAYHALPEEPLVVAATCAWGDTRLTAAIAVRNVFAVQFRPEQSQQAGLSLLAAFLGWSG